MKFIVAQLGARMHYAVPRILYAAGMLQRLYTDACAVKGFPRFLKVIPPRVRPLPLRRLMGRVPHGIPPETITAFTSFGLKYEKRRRNVKNPGEAMAAHLWAGRSFCERVIAAGGFQGQGVYTFNGAGLELLRAAAVHGLRRIMEQTIAPMAIEQELLAGELEKFREWHIASDAAPPIEEWITRERSEWAASERILCGSEFVRNGIGKCGGPIERCVVVPYGVANHFEVRERRAHSGPLRILTVGAIGLRKGSPYVLAAARRLKGVARFRMCGGFAVPQSIISKLSEQTEITGPVPRPEMIEHFKWADVFLLPSVCEGSALATYEALMAGLPVICTPNTGSIVTDEVNGIIVPQGDVDAIVSALERFASSRGVLEQFQRGVKDSSAEASLDAYGARLIMALRAAQ